MATENTPSQIPEGFEQEFLKEQLKIFLKTASRQLVDKINVEYKNKGQTFQITPEHIQDIHGKLVKEFLAGLKEAYEATKGEQTPRVPENRLEAQNEKIEVKKAQRQSFLQPDWAAKIDWSAATEIANQFNNPNQDSAKIIAHQYKNALKMALKPSRPEPRPEPAPRPTKKITPRPPGI